CVLAYVYITSGNRFPEPGKGGGSTAYVGQKPYQTIVLNLGSKRLVVMVIDEQDKKDGRLNLENPMLSVELLDFDIEDLDDEISLDQEMRLSGARFQGRRLGASHAELHAGGDSRSSALSTLGAQKRADCGFVQLRPE